MRSCGLLPADSFSTRTAGVGIHVFTTYLGPAVQSVRGRDRKGRGVTAPLRAIDRRDVRTPLLVMVMVMVWLADDHGLGSVFRWLVACGLLSRIRRHFVHRPLVSASATAADVSVSVPASNTTSDTGPVTQPWRNASLEPYEEHDKAYWT